jgi:hypothetical protein
MTTETEAKRTLEEIDVPADEQPMEKKPKTNMDALKKQVEYYLSDANLKHDKFFHTKLSEGTDGWMSLTHILACNKLKTLTTESMDIVEAVSNSTEIETNESGDSIRRKNPLPVFEGELRRTPKATKDKNPAVYKKQILFGDFKFPNLAAAKKRVGEILKSRRAGVIFKEGTPDYNLVLAVLAEHPNAQSKMEGMTGLKVDAAPVGDSRCFFIVKGENKDQFEDISIVKAFGNFEQKLISQADAAPSPAKEEASESQERTIDVSAE